MLLYAVILFGLIIVFQLQNISGRLERLEGISKDIAEELQTVTTDILNILATIELNTSED